MLIVLKMNRKLCFFPSPFFSRESFFTQKCTFFSIAKVFVAKFAEKSVIRESLCPQFRDFFFSRNFVPAKVSAPKVFTRCDNSSQNLGCLKTSTSHKCSTKENAYWQVYKKGYNSTKHINHRNHLFYQGITSTEPLQRQQNV